MPVRMEFSVRTGPKLFDVVALVKMMKAHGRAFRWRKLLETGAHGTIEEIAAAEKINSSYVSRILRLTLLAPDIVEAILDGRQATEMTLALLMRPFAVLWDEQRIALICVRVAWQGQLETPSAYSFNELGSSWLGPPITELRTE
jgi:hypothetical protein